MSIVVLLCLTVLAGAAMAAVEPGQAKTRTIVAVCFAVLPVLALEAQMSPPQAAVLSAALAAASTLLWLLVRSRELAAELAPGA